MGELPQNVWKMIENLGSTGLLLLFGWKFLDRWAGKFLQAQQQSAAAMTSLADAVREGQTDQREVLLAVRVQSRKIEEMKNYLVQLDEHVCAIGEKS